MHTLHTLFRKRLWFFSTLVILITMAGCARAQAVYVPSQTSDIKGLTSMLIQARRMGYIGGLVGGPGFYAATYAPGANVVCHNTRMRHPVHSNVTGLRLVYSNMSCVAAQILGANQITIKAAIEYPAGTFYPVYFSGSRTVTLDPGATIVSDPVDITINAASSATYLWSRTEVTVASAGQNWPYCPESQTGSTNQASIDSTFNQDLTQTATVQATCSSATNTGNAVITLSTSPLTTNAWANLSVYDPSASPTTMQVVSNTANTITVSGTYTTPPANGHTITLGMLPFSNTKVFAPCAILAIPDRKVPHIAIVGDSISAGHSDSNSTNSSFGWLANQFQSLGSMGYILLGSDGNTANAESSAANYALKWQLVNNCDYAVCELGINDYGQSFSSLKTLLTSIWNNLNAMGIRVYQSTICPRTVSSDSFTNGGNQKAYSQFFGNTTTYGAAPYAVASTASANGTTTTLTDTTQSWTTNQWAGHTVLFTSGLNNTQTATVSSNNATSLTFTSALPNATATGDAYNIYCVRTMINDWIRTKPAPLYGYLDPCLYCEVNASNVLTLDGGFWQTNGTAFWGTSDGTHPNSPLITNMQACITASQFLPY